MKLKLEDVDKVVSSGLLEMLSKLNLVGQVDTIIALLDVIEDVRAVFTKKEKAREVLLDIHSAKNEKGERIYQGANKIVIADITSWNKDIETLLDTEEEIKDYSVKLTLEQVKQLPTLNAEVMKAIKILNLY